MDSQCNLCKRNHGNGTCDAFPVQIPYTIETNRIDHRIRYPGDNGMTFDPSNEEALKTMDQMFGELPEES